MEVSANGSEDLSKEVRSLITDYEDSQNDEKHLTMEDVLKELGVLGKYQVIQITCACASCFPYVFALFNIVFLGYEPSHTCGFVNETSLLDRYGLMNDSTAKISYGSCSIGVSFNRTGQKTNIVSLECYNGYSYAGGKDTSMVTEWDLVCDKLGVAELVQTIFTLGMAICAVFVTSLGDRYGRKYPFMFALTGLFVTELGLAFASSIYVACGIRFLSGLFAGGILTLRFVPCMELIISKYRQIFGAIDCIIWSLAIVILSGIGYYLRHYNWRYLQLVTSCSLIPVIICSYFINETPAWYMAKGKSEEAQRILTKACKLNGKNVEQFIGIVHSYLRQEKVLNASSTPSHPRAVYSLLDIIRNKYLFTVVSICCLIWFSNSLIYYGLFLTSSSIAGNRFLNFFLMAIIEIPSNLVNMSLLIYLGRRTVLLLSMALSGMCLLVSTILVGLNSESEHAINSSTAFFLLGKFTITCCFNVVYAYTPEVFPTTIRATGLSLCVSVARVAGMLAPFLLPLFKIVPWAPGTVLVILCFSSVCLIPVLPETRGRELPTTVEDALAWKESKKQEINC